MLKGSALSDCIEAFSFTEDQRNAPNAGKSDHRVDDPAQDRHGAAYPGNDVKIEKTDTTPVESADNSENKSYSVYYHHNKKPLKSGIRPKNKGCYYSFAEQKKYVSKNMDKNKKT